MQAIFKKLLLVFRNFMQLAKAAVRQISLSESLAYQGI
jgi:hypothetical protein